MKRPTSLEQRFIEFTQKYGLPYKYTGDGDFIIGGKNPDFVNVNGEKICIEVRNEQVCKYIQKISLEAYEKQRVEHFSKYGWKCFVFSEKSFANPQYILEKIQNLGDSGTTPLKTMQ